MYERNVTVSFPDEEVSYSSLLWLEVVLEIINVLLKIETMLEQVTQVYVPI